VSLKSGIGIVRRSDCSYAHKAPKADCHHQHSHDVMLYSLHCMAYADRFDIESALEQATAND